MNFNTDRPARTPQQLGAILAETRAAMGLTQEEVAERLGAYRTNVSQVERGKATIQTQTIFDLLHELGLEINVRSRT